MIHPGTTSWRSVASPRRSSGWFASAACCVCCSSTSLWKTSACNSSLDSLTLAAKLTTTLLRAARYVPHCAPPRCIFLTLISAGSWLSQRWLCNNGHAHQASPLLIFVLLFLLLHVVGCCPETNLRQRKQLKRQSSYLLGADHVAQNHIPDTPVRCRCCVCPDTDERQAGRPCKCCAQRLRK